MRVRLAVLAAAVLSDCLDPTEIVVVVSTDVPCAQVNSTAIAVGRPGDDTNLTSAKTTSCSDDGGLGTLVVTPSHGIGDAVGVRVTVGIGATQADTCAAPSFTGCIVARRSLAYYPHHPLTLPIDMQQACEDRACDPSSTCVNGSCVDAGIPSCDQSGTCTLDAGIPDAGPCDIAPRLVTPVAAQVTPRVVQTKAGYAVGWETAAISDPSRAYRVVALDRNGSPGKVVEITNAVAPGTMVGPLGTDGTNFAATFEPSSSAYVFRVIDPNGSIVNEGTGPGPVQLSRAGMRYDPSDPAYVFFFINASNNPTFQVWSATTAKTSGTGIGVTGMNDTALSYFNGFYYGAYHDASSCFLANAQVSLTTGTAGMGASYPLCTTIRFAENAPSVDLVATREADSSNPAAFRLVARASFATSAPSMTVDGVDDQAIALLPGVGNRFHLVYGVSQSVRETTIDATLAYSAPKTIANATGFSAPVSGSTGFDALAEPGTMIHDVVFWASTPTPGIYFTRICN